jgi:hypothetical protein
MPCATCRSGCGCPLTGPGCGHYGCYGRGPTDCPGAEAEQRRYDALLDQRRRDARAIRLRRVRLAATYAALTQQFAYGLRRP